MTPRRGGACAQGRPGGARRRCRARAGGGAAGAGRARGRARGRAAAAAVPALGPRPAGSACRAAPRHRPPAVRERRHRRPPPPLLLLLRLLLRLLRPPPCPSSRRSERASEMAAAGALAKHEQILVLDPPTDLKFKGEEGGTRRGGGERGGSGGVSRSAWAPSRLRAPRSPLPPADGPRCRALPARRGMGGAGERDRPPPSWDPAGIRGAGWDRPPPPCPCPRPSRRVTAALVGPAPGQRRPGTRVSLSGRWRCGLPLAAAGRRGPGAGGGSIAGYQASRGCPYAWPCPTFPLRRVVAPVSGWSWCGSAPSVSGTHALAPVHRSPARGSPPFPQSCHVSGRLSDRKQGARLFPGSEGNGMRAFRKFYVCCVLRADRMAVTADVLLSK